MKDGLRGVLAGLALSALAAMSAVAQQTPPPAEFEQPREIPAAPAPEVLPSQTINGDADAPMPASVPVLTVDQERLFANSAWGRRAQADLEEEGRSIAAENDRIAQQLSQEEAALTEKRKTLAAAQFRKEAEAFDTRATAIRRERAQVVQELNARADADRSAFYQAALPVMGDLMQRRGAVVVLDRRTVFVSLDAIDITDALIAELDRLIGPGPVAEAPKAESE